MKKQVIITALQDAINVARRHTLTPEEKALIDQSDVVLAGLQKTPGGQTFPFIYNGWKIEMKTGADFGCRGSVRKSRGYLCTKEGEEKIEIRPISGSHGSLATARMMCDQRNELRTVLEQKYKKETANESAG